MGSLNTIFLGLLDEDAPWGKYAFHPEEESEESDEELDDESEVKSMTIGCLLILILCLVKGFCVVDA